VEKKTGEKKKKKKPGHQATEFWHRIEREDPWQELFRLFLGKNRIDSRAPRSAQNPSIGEGFFENKRMRKRKIEIVFDSLKSFLQVTRIFFGHPRTSYVRSAMHHNNCSDNNGNNSKEIEQHPPQPQALKQVLPKRSEKTKQNKKKKNNNQKEET
jgi:hypothetical protein